MRSLSIKALSRCHQGAAAAEMALVTPLLIILMFGSFELGNYFLSEHVVVKAVRDGARYASRLNLDHFKCDDSKLAAGNLLTDTSVKENIQNLVRTGLLAPEPDDEAKLRGWTDGSAIGVEYDCVDVNTVDPPYGGIYKDYVPVVHITVKELDYPFLFNNLGFTSSVITLNAEAQSAVMGI